ncbi:hypothetical protein ACLOJK_007178, partial [Asimina triloba]
LDAFIGVDDDPCLIGADNGPYLKKGSVGRFLPPSSVPHRCSADRYLWRELLTRRLSQGYVEFLVRRDVKGIDNPPDCVLGWEARFFFARLTSKGDIWGVLEPWEESLPDLIPRSRLSLPAPQRWALMEQLTLKRVRPLEEEGNLANSDSSAREAPGSSSSGQLTPAAELEGMAPPSVAARLKEELKASRAEVARLQSMLQGDVARPSTISEYLRSNAYRRQVEFE